MTDSLVQRVTRSMWLLAAAACGFLAVFSTVVVLRNSDTEARQRIKAEQSNLVGLGLIDLISLNAFYEVIPRLPSTLQTDRLSQIIRIYDTKGSLLFTNLKVPDLDNADAARLGNVDKDFYEIEGESRDYLARLRSHRAMDGDVLWIEIATPRPRVSAVLRQITVPIFLTLLVLMGLSLPLARFVTRRILRPLSHMSEQIDRLDVARFKTWTPLSEADQPPEFHPILRKVSELLRRIQKAFLSSHRLAQFVTHEIRTPLTVLRGEMETTLMNPAVNADEYQAILRSALEEVNKIEEIVTTVLALARRDRGTPTCNPAAVPLEPFFRDLLPRLTAASHREISFQAGPESRRDVFVDPDLLALLVSNLIRNVALHTPSHTPCRIETGKRSEDLCRIRVSDTGPGMGEAILKAANSPDPPEGALGVGLTLCRLIAGVSRWDLVFRNGPDGGLTVEITCPFAPEITKS